MIKIFDKASWHIDECMPKAQVVSHFKFIFGWLEKNKLLSDDGMEILNIGIDESISLNEKMLKKEAFNFIEKYYNKYLESIQYGIEENEKLLDKYYAEFLNKN